MIATVCSALLPVFNVPNARLAGVALICPCGLLIPTPLNGIVSVGVLGSLLTNAMLPPIVDAVSGLNVIVSVVACPGGIVAGVVNPVTPKSLP